MMKLKLATSHSDGSVVTFGARVIRFEANRSLVWVQIPDRVRALPFPPYDGKRYVQFAVATLQPSQFYRS